MPAVMMAPQPGIGASGRPLPQTSNPPAGSGPFLRYARAASRVGYNVSGIAFGGQVTNPLAAAPGYLRWLDVTVVSSGGTSAAAVASADSTSSGVANTFTLIQLKDPWGTPLLTGDGFSLCYLLQKYSGQGFSPIYNANTTTQLPSYSAISTAGNYTTHLMLPIEGTKGYGVISIGNSSVLPSLLLQTGVSTAGANNIFSTAPTATVPTLQVIVDEFYYDVDPSNPVEPPGNGSTFQTAVVQGNQTIGSAASTRVQLPRTGGYLTSLILMLRDNTGVRAQDTAGVGWNSTNGRIRDVGVIAYSFKSSLSQLNLGYLDTLEQALQTNPGTLIEVEMTPWGTTPQSPNVLYAIITQLVPSGPIAQGLPEV